MSALAIRARLNEIARESASRGLIQIVARARSRSRRTKSKVREFS